MRKIGCRTKTNDAAFHGAKETCDEKQDAPGAAADSAGRSVLGVGAGRLAQPAGAPHRSVSARRWLDRTRRAVSLAQKLSDLWGQPVILDNRPGAGAVLATNVVAKAPPDGYTLGIVVLVPC